MPPPPSKIEVREHPSRGVFLSGGKSLRVPVGHAKQAGRAFLQVVQYGYREYCRFNGGMGWYFVFEVIAHRYVSRGKSVAHDVDTIVSFGFQC